MGVVISIKMRDSEGAIESVPFYLDNTINTVAAASGIADTLAVALNGISDCGVVQAYGTFQLALTDPNAVGTPSAGSRRDAGATFSFYNSAARAHSLFVPGVNLQLIDSGIVDLGDSSVDAFVQAIINSGAHITDENLLKLVDIRKAYQSTRKTRR